MSTSKLRSISWHLRVLVAAGLLPLLSAVGWLIYNQLQGDLRSSQESLIAHAQVLAGDSDRSLSRLAQALTLVAARPRVAALDPARCDPDLAHLAELFAVPAANILTLSAERRWVCSLLPLPASAPLVKRTHVAHSFVQARQTGRPAIGKPGIGPISDRPVLPVIAPILDAAGDFRGAVMFAIDLQAFSTTRAPASLPAHLVGGVVSADGIHVTRWPDPSLWAGTGAAPFETTRLSGGAAPQIFNAVDSHGVEWLYAARPTREGELWAYVGARTEDLYGPALRHMWVALGLAILTTALVGFLSWRLACRVAVPIRDMAAGAREVVAGNLGARVDPGGTTETAAMAQSFNALVTTASDHLTKLRMYQEHLEGLVEQRTFALRAARDGAEAATQAKAAFLANMSHELRTPLNGIIGMTELARRRATDPVQQERLAKAQRASRHLLAIINDILDLSKVEAGRLRLERVTLTPGEVVTDSLKLIQPLAQDRGLALVVDVPPAVSVLRLLGDPTRLQQVLVNLLGNAVKFTPAGQVTLRGRIESDDGMQIMLRVEVQDTGVGIASDAATRLFTPFEQLDPAVARKYGGTGLGLAICKLLVQAMGGDIGVHSRPSEGSTFWFTARLARAQAAQVDPAMLPPEQDAETQLRARYAGARVLVCEDDPDAQDYVRILLEQAGLIVELAADGVLAQAAASARRYDLILMDLRMPGVDGLHAALAIRDGPLNAGTPIVAVTSSAFDEDRRACLDAGMDDHLAKPISPEGLFAVVLRWLRLGHTGLSAPGRAAVNDR